MAFNADMLALVEAELLRRASGGFVESYTQGSDSIQTMSTEELKNYRKELRADAAAESRGASARLADLRGR